jgi:integration host factor alpha subunit
MKKVDMVQRMVQELGCTTTTAEAVVEAILAAVKDALRQGETVTLRGLGTFQVRAKQARMGRNPRTGAAAPITARRVVRFTAGQPLKQAVAETTHPSDGAGPPGGERRPR